jgi:hypothetical protein
MSQSRKHSVMETITGNAIGFAFSQGLSYVVYPLFGHAFSFGENIWIILIFTVASLVRGYWVRRLFNHLGTRHG